MSRVLGVIAHRVTFMGGAVGTAIMFIEILNRVLDYYKFPSTSTYYFLGHL